MGHPKRNAFGELPTLPNFESPHRTTTSVYIDTHYAQLNLIYRWTWDRYARLSEVLQFTPYELGSYVLLRHKAVDRFRERNTILGEHAPAVALLLTILEATLLGNRAPDTIRDPFPKLKNLTDGIP